MDKDFLKEVVRLSRMRNISEDFRYECLRKLLTNKCLSISHQDMIFREKVERMRQAQLAYESAFKLPDDEFEAMCERLYKIKAEREQAVDAFIFTNYNYDERRLNASALPSEADENSAGGC